MKYKIIIIFLIALLVTTGCTLFKNKNTDKKNQVKQTEDVKNDRKYYDESRLQDKATSYAELFDHFSFIVDHPVDPDNEFGDTLSRVYSFKSNGNVNVGNIYNPANNMSSNTLLYKVNENTVYSVSISPSVYTRSNYKDKISNDIKIIKETDEYVEMENEVDNYYLLLKFLDDQTLLFNTSRDISLEHLEEVANTITVDNGDALLVDKIVQYVVNYNGKQLKTYNFISSMEPDRGIDCFSKKIHMRFSYQRYFLTSCSEFFSEKISDDPELYKCSDNEYKVLKTDNPVETYYYFTKVDGAEDKYFDKTSLDNFKSLGDIFFEK